MPDLNGETVTLTVNYQVFGDTFVNLDVFTATFAVGAGAEVTGQAISASFQSGGFTQTLTGTISVDVSATGITVTFSGTQQAGGLSFILSSVADQSAGSVTSVTQTAISGFTNGVNQPLAPSFSNNANGSITVGFQPFGFEPGVNLSQTSSFVLADPVAPTVTNLSGDSVSYTEGGAAIRIDAPGALVSITDPDAPSGLNELSMNGAVVTITDFVAGDVLAYTLVGSITGSYSNGVLTLSGAGSRADYRNVLRSITFESTNDDLTAGGTDTQRSITTTVTDLRGLTSTAATSTVTLVAVDDPGIANNDAFVTDEATALGAGQSLFNNNGSGVDLDPDGGPFAVTAVAGGVVGTQFVLPSGALLTVNADGTFIYDPNGAFDTTPVFDSGAVNTPATDSFTYTVTGGDTATVTITINGLDTGDILNGVVGDDSLFGGVGEDTLNGLDGFNRLYGGTGADDLFGGTGRDFYYVDDAGDVVSDAGGTGDRVIITSGDWTLGAGQDIEIVQLVDNAGGTVGGNERDNVIYGAAGADQLNGNAGNDLLIGGAGSDVMDGGAGNDSFRIQDSGDSVVEGAGGGADTAFVLAGQWTLGAGQEVERIFGQNAGGVDITGNELANIIIGTAAADTLAGADGTDKLFGGGGGDSLSGGGARDWLEGGAGDDTMSGGEGRDMFVFSTTAGDFDTVTDFDAGAGVGDRVRISSAVLADFAAVLLAANDVAVGGNTAVEITAGGATLRLEGVLLADLVADDFVLF